MNDREIKNETNITDPLLNEKDSYSAVLEPDIREYPKQFVKIDQKIIKAVSLYLQLLWDANCNGKTINISEVLNNVKNLFVTRFQNKDVYVIRHVASDLREIELYNWFDINKYFKNIDLGRLDIDNRIKLSKFVSEYFSEIVHFNYINGKNGSYEKVKKINDELAGLGFDDIDIPNTKDEYITKLKFEDIFEKVSIIFIMNYYAVFSEFLFNED